MRSQQCLNIFFGIFSYLLEFVNSDNTRFIRMSQILNNLIKCIFRAVNISQFHIKYRKIGNGIKPELAADGFDCLHEKFRHFAAAWQKGSLSRICHSKTGSGLFSPCDEGI